MGVVAFDEVLDVVHELALDEPPLGCPRGVPVLEETAPGMATAWGRRLVVYPCALPVRHDGDCEARTSRARLVWTRCGKKGRMWIDWPSGARPCPKCAR